MQGGIKSVRLLALVVLAALARQGATQNPEGDPAGSTAKPSISISRPPGSRTCPGLVPSASRTREGCEPTTTIITVETEATVTLKLPTIESVHCAAIYAVEYTQRNTVVSVEGVVENKVCAASNGEYKLMVSIRDENGELKTLDFSESWQRQDDRPVKFTGDYPIGENVEVVRVRPIHLRCTCTDAPEE